MDDDAELRLHMLREDIGPNADEKILTFLLADYEERHGHSLVETMQRTEALRLANNSLADMTATFNHTQALLYRVKDDKAIARQLLFIRTLKGFLLQAEGIARGLGADLDG